MICHKKKSVMKKNVICFVLVAVSIVMSLINVLSANSRLNSEIEYTQSSFENEEIGSSEITDIRTE